MASSGQDPYIYDTSHEDESDNVPGSVTSVEVAPNVTRIHSKAFKNCPILTHVSLPSSSSLKVIGENAFNNCRSLKSIWIPPSVEVIGSGAFCDCSSLETVVLPRVGLKAIPHACFIRCTSLENITIPSSVVDIRVNAFSNCEALPYVKLPMGLETIGKGSFSNCPSLSRVLVPSTVISIGMMAFAYCNGLDTVEISIVSSELQSIGRYAFHRCMSLLSVALPKSCGVDLTAFMGSRRLNQAFGSDGKALIDYLKNRFDSLQCHAFCYQQVHESMFDGTGISKMEDSERIYPTDTTDVFGLTPFHILALSSRPNIETFQMLLKEASCPVDQLWQCDVFGNTAFRYAISTATPGVAVFFNAMLHAIVDRRVEWLGLEPWKLSIVQKLDMLLAEDAPEEREHEIISLFALLHLHERKETLSLLDEAVWKHSIRQSQKELDAAEGERDAKRLKTGKDNSPNNARLDRQRCYLNSGAEAVIVNTLPYLGPIVKTIKF
ncbi:MAG: hypothetical protein SGBAC_011091 [Bacillariaceae sp.]